MRDTCDVDPVDLYSERLVMARKAHRCCETGRTIQPGERHWRMSMLYDGRFDTYRQSWAAYRLARSLNFTDGQHACWIEFGGLAEAMHWHLDDAENPDAVDAEWKMVKQGIITREPVGDELEYLASRGIDPPPVVPVIVPEVAA